MIQISQIVQNVDLSVDPTTEVINLQVTETPISVILELNETIAPQIILEVSEHGIEGNNIDILKRFKFSTNGANLTTNLLAKLNSLPEYTVNEIQSLWILATQVNLQNELVDTSLYKIINKGKGTYGLGKTQFISSDLLFIANRNATPSDIIDDETTIVIDLGEETNHVISDLLNNQSPSISIQDQSLGLTLFTVLDQDITYTYLWTGNPGNYGLAELQSNLTDFQLLETDQGFVFNPSDYDLEDFNNASANPFVRANEIPIPTTPRLQQVSDEGGFDNGATLKQGTTDAGLGGNKGIALRCSIDYELKWEAGRLYVMEQDGFAIREVRYTFTDTPSSVDDITKGFEVGSRWVLDDNSTYVCLDNTLDNAVWELLYIVADAITSGDTTHAPSGNALFDEFLLKANLTGAVFTGQVEVPPIPLNANSVVPKNYLDNLLTSITWKNAVKCATTTNHPLSGTANVDGITVPAGTRVLVKNQTVTSQNGIYISAAGAWTRATDCDSTEEIEQSTVLVTSGSVNRNTQWTQSLLINTIDVDPITYVQISGAGTYTNGLGIQLTANVFSINATTLGALLFSLGSKNTLVDADTTVSYDSVSTLAVKTTWANVWLNYIKAKADAVYTTTSAVASQISAALVAKFDVPSGGISNYLIKFNTSTTGIISRLFDNGTFFGIGTTTTPTKDLTLGNQANREIGVEQSNNISPGRDLTLSAGRTIDFIPNAGFELILSQNTLHKNSDSFSNGDILFSSTNFQTFKLNANTLAVEVFGSIQSPMCMTIDSSDNVYAVIIEYTGNRPLYYSANGGLTYSTVAGVTSRDYQFIKIMPNGDLYATLRGSTDIYKRTGGTGDLVPMGFTPRDYSHLTSTPTGDLYISVAGGDMYKINSGTSVLTALGQTLRNWGASYYLSGNLYVSAGVGGVVYKQIGLAGNFVLDSTFTYPIMPVGSYPGNNLCVQKNTNNVFAFNTNVGIYVQYNNGAGTPNLKGGTNKIKAGTGKGTGESNIEIYTGQKTVSGTDMQIEAKRLTIDNEGQFTIETSPNTGLPTDMVLVRASDGKMKQIDIVAVPTTTGVVISFQNDRVYGSIASPETGNITANITGAKLGVTNIIIHNSGTAPTFGAEFKKLSGSGNYVTSVVNYIYCTYITATEIIYSINQRT